MPAGQVGTGLGVRLGAMAVASVHLLISLWHVLGPPTNLQSQARLVFLACALLGDEGRGSRVLHGNIFRIKWGLRRGL